MQATCRLSEAVAINKANQILGSQTGSQRSQAPADAGRRLATISPASWLSRRCRATSCDAGPHSGDDTCDLIGHALRQLAGRRGAWPGDDLTDHAGRFLPELVTSARFNVYTWHDIAQALVTSPDEAAGDPAPTPRSPTAAGPTTPETAKAGPLQAVTTAPNPHPAGPDQAARAAPDKTVLTTPPADR
jgi:hypothetical protein